MNIRFFKIAQQELDSAIEYYNNERSGLGYEFLWEIFATIDRIKEFPEAWNHFTKRLVDVSLDDFHTVSFTND